MPNGDRHKDSLIGEVRTWSPHVNFTTMHWTLVLVPGCRGVHGNWRELGEFREQKNTVSV